MKRVAILGSTGSIGRSTLDVIARNSGKFKVVALTAGRNIDLLDRQIRTFRPELAAVSEKKDAENLKKRTNGTEILFGAEGIHYIAAHENSDFVLSSIVGSAGLVPTVAAIRAGKTIGLANKEALVMAGDLVMREARKFKSKIIPVDSEHSAVFQCMGRCPRGDVRRIILTASGGPFFKRGREELKNISVEDALNHPKWKMGRKISIDSATLMNKGLEVIEACRLFDLPPEKVDVLVHPQSIVHSLVEFTDRSCLAQMSVPDMRGPISYALAYPERVADPIEGLDLETVGTLTFQKPDTETFPCLAYAYEAIGKGGTMPGVLNAANEIAVNAFLGSRIGFTEIADVIRKTLDDHKPVAVSTLEEVLLADNWARKRAEEHIKEISG